MASLQFDHVWKTFRTGRRDVAVLDDVCFAVSDREFVAIVGPSGCGKTTTLRILAGLERPSSGVVRIADRVMDGVSPRDRNMAMVFQHFALYPHMTVYENLAFGLRMRKTPRAVIDDRVRQMADVLKISPLLQRKPAALSGGEQQRVALGRALVRRPAAIMLDEPLSNLDAGMRQSLRREIRTLHDSQEATTLYVTHDQEEAMALADRIIVMQRGRVRQIATPHEMYHQPLDRFVGSFFGSPSMNFIPVSCSKAGAESVCESALGRWSLPCGMEGPAVMGVRPEDVRVVSNPADAAPGSAGWIRFSKPLVVQCVEALGPATLIRMAAFAGEDIVARVQSTSLRPGTAVWVEFDPQKLHVFDADEMGRRRK